MSTPTFDVPDGRLEQHFGDKRPVYGADQALAEASRCLYCQDAPCIHACPTRIDIPSFIRKIATGNPRGSARTILRANLLGASCARVCPVEVLCEGSCVYHEWGQPPIAIGRLQRYAMEVGASPQLLRRAPPSGRSVGLVGGGPASLACAGTLVLLGHRAVVYEKAALPGGLNTMGIAPYKLSVADALDEVAFVQDLGVELHSGIEVGRDLAVPELLARHDAVFLGVGLGSDSALPAAGASGPGVVGAVEWIAGMKTDPQACVDGVESAVVVGGGNTAVDVARELCGLGVESVALVYRRAEPAMSAYAHELDAARREGAVLIEQAVVGEILRTDGRVSGIRLMLAEEGRATDQEIGVQECDLVVVAIGQSKLRDLVEQFDGVVCDPAGRIVADPETGATGNARVFAGGDARNGGKEVVNAVAEGQAAARAIDAVLRGRA